MEQIEVTNEMVSKAQRGDEDAKTQLFLSVKGMIRKTVITHNDGVFDEDLASICYMGVIKAIDTFDCSKEAKFSTHVYWKVRGELSHEFDRRGRAKRVPSDLTISIATPVFGKSGSEDGTIEDYLHNGMNDYEYIHNDGDKNIWWAYEQLNNNEQKLFYYKYIKQVSRDELRVLMGLNTNSYLRKKEVQLKQKLSNLMELNYTYKI